MTLDIAGRIALVTGADGGIDRVARVLLEQGVPAFLGPERASFINGANMRIDSGSVMTI